MSFPNRTAQQNEWLHEAASRIRQHPAAYRQDYWFGDKNRADYNGEPQEVMSSGNDPKAEQLWLDSMNDPECGSVACLCGHLGLVMQQNGVHIWNEWGVDISRVKQEVGFNRSEQLIFAGDASYWPDEYRIRYEEANDNNDPEGMAKAAADLLDDIADGLIWKDEGENGEFVYTWTTLAEYLDKRDAEREEENVICD